jgi:hypothetical protein
VVSASINRWRRRYLSVYTRLSIDRSDEGDQRREDVMAKTAGLGTIEIMGGGAAVADPLVALPR